MMRRRVVRVFRLPKGAVEPGLLLLGACFLAGTVAGCVWAAAVSEDGAVLASYIQEYLSLAKSGEVVLPAMTASLWEVFRWPLLTVLMGLTALGAVGLPVLFAARGFLLSFAAASFIKILGGTGGALAFLLLGTTGVFALPVFFLLGTQGFSAGRELLLRKGKKRRGKPGGGILIFRGGICTAVLLFCVFLERNVIPAALVRLAGEL